MAIVPSVQIGWAHEFLDTRGRVAAAFIGVPGSGFVTQSAPFGRDSAIVGIDATIETGTPVAVRLGYTGALSRQGSEQAVSGGIRVAF
jgi:uncharacterized protein with beta-barrel porin domain